MEPFWTTLTSPSVNFGASLRLWILLLVMAGVVALVWRYRHNQTEDRVLVAYKRGYREGLTAGYKTGKDMGVTDTVLQNYIDSGMSAITLHLMDQS